jgi:hypothetical protein
MSGRTAAAGSVRAAFVAVGGGAFLGWSRWTHRWRVPAILLRSSRDAACTPAPPGASVAASLRRARGEGLSRDHMALFPGKVGRICNVHNQKIDCLRWPHLAFAGPILLSSNCSNGYFATLSS